MQDFDIYFSGKLLKNANYDTCKEKIGKLFNISGESLDKLFSGKAVRVKKSVDVKLANQFRAVFTDAGALVDIVPEGQKPAPTKVPSEVAVPAVSPTLKVADDQGMSLSAVNTGSLADCAIEVEAQPIADINDISLSDAGEILIAETQITPVDIDISSLSLGDANSGSLEDCQQEITPQEIADISAISLDPID